MALRPRLSHILATTIRRSSPATHSSYAFLASSSCIRTPRRFLHSSRHPFVLSQTPQSAPSTLPSSVLPSTVLPSVTTSSSPPAPLRGPTVSTPESATPILSQLEADVVPLPCAYTPPEIAPLLSVKAVAQAMEEIIVSVREDEAVPEKKESVVEVKGLEELVADVQAKATEAKMALKMAQASSA